ncbi:MAG: T9SS type A sorting domain-containing protein [Alphaproteobacteria bacterium]|nr:T9SS type A sorting domain-containing protein [Alphaproteobacteria bacterium]
MKTNFILFLISLIFLPTYFWGQNQFQRAVVAHGSFPEGLIQTSDESYIIIGTYNDSPEADILVSKLDKVGNLVWSNSIGKSGQQQGFSITEVSDGGYIGIAGSYGSHYQSFFKLSKDGNFIWEKVIYSFGTKVIHLIDLIKTNDEGYVLVGSRSDTISPSSNSKLFIAKLNSDFTFQWQKYIGYETGETFGASVIQTTDGGYAVAGPTDSYGTGGRDIFVIKLDLTGNIVWSKTIGGTDDDVASDMKQTNDGGFIIVGESFSYGAGNCDIYAVKIDEAGNLQWTRTIGGKDKDYGSSVIQTLDGGIVIAGGIDDNELYPMYLVKLSITGDLVWTKVSNIEDGIYGLITNCLDGGYAVSCCTGLNEMMLIKFDLLENTCSTFDSGGEITSGGIMHNVEWLSENGNSVIIPGSGFISTHNGSLKNICDVNGFDSQGHQNSALSVEPNPCVEKFRVNIHLLSTSSNNTLSLTDLHGTKTFEKYIGNLSNGYYTFEIDSYMFPSGIYVLSLLSDDLYAKVKLVKE